MFWIIVTIVIILASFALEYFLSGRKNKWLGLILPVVCFIAASLFLVLNLTDTFPGVEWYGLFLIEYGSAGLFAMILKIGFLYTPAAIQLVIYFVCRHYYKKRNGPAKGDKEFRKMMVDDLD